MKPIVKRACVLASAPVVFPLALIAAGVWSGLFATHLVTATPLIYVATGKLVMDPDSMVDYWISKYRVAPTLRESIETSGDPVSL